MSDEFPDGGNGYSWCAVDEDVGTAWAPNSGDYNEHYFIVEFSRKRVVKEYELLGMYCFGVTPNFYIQASNDKENWINLENELHAGSPSGIQKYNVQLENKKAYKYYRIYCPTGSGWTWGSSGAGYIYDLKLYGY